MSLSMLLLHSEDEPHAALCQRLFAAQLQAGARRLVLPTPDAASHQIGANPAHDTPADAPDQIVICAPSPQAWAWIAQHGPGCKAPITLLSDWPPTPATMVEHPLHLVAGWWPLASLSPEQCPAALALDRQRWLQARQTEQLLRNTQERLEDRKWIERAKDLLTGARGIGEDQAFALLRSAAMQAQLKLGSVSRQVVEATDWADAINRAGQFRMLSQRLIKLQAMRLADMDAKASALQLQDAVEKGHVNLKRLKSLRQHQGISETIDRALAATELQWQGLVDGLGLAPQARSTPAGAGPNLAVMDARAERLLQAAERLTDALELQGGRQALHVINLCGRQRMRIQRLAKDALLANQLGTAHAEALQVHVGDFESALKELEQLPLSNIEIRNLLNETRQAWLALTQGLDRDPLFQHLNALVHTSDTVLQLLEQLTSAYEHSLQVMLA